MSSAPVTWASVNSTPVDTGSTSSTVSLSCFSGVAAEIFAEYNTHLSIISYFCWHSTSSRYSSSTHRVTYSSNTISVNIYSLFSSAITKENQLVKRAHRKDIIVSITYV